MTDLIIQKILNLSALNSLNELSKGQCTLLEKLTKNCNEVAFSSITALAKIHDVHPSNITRLAQKLGFDGFNEFQSVFQSHLSDSNRFYSQKINDSSKVAMDDVFQTTINCEMANIKHISKSISLHRIERISNLITNSDNIYLYGAKQFYSIASFFHYGLSLILDNVYLLNNDNHGLGLSVSKIKSNDVVILLSCHPYSPTSSKLSSLIASLNISTIALTDNPDCKIATNSNEFIILPTDSNYYGNSIAAWTVFIEALLTYIAHSNSQDSISTLDNQEHLSRLLND